MPLAIVGLPVEDYPLYLSVLVFVTLMPAACAGLVHGGGEHGLKGRQVLVLAGVLVAYVAAVSVVLVPGGT